MKISELRYQFKSMSRKEIENIVVDLYKSNAFCKDYISNILHPESEIVLLEKHKLKIRNEFFPDRGDPKLRFSILRKTLSDYKKIYKDPQYYAELILYYIECGVEFANQYGDIDENYYTRLGHLYSDALGFIFDQKLEKIFEDKCFKIKISSEGIGWGFEHEMDDLYYAYYDYEEDNID